MSSGTPSQEIDWAGTWFPIMERLGESTDMLLAKVDSKGTPRWHVIRHTENDGIGAMTLLLHGPDAALVAAKKNVKDTVAPNPFKILWAILRYTWMVGTQKTLWKSYDPTQVGCSPAVAWATFNLEDTEHLNEFVRLQKTSLNTLLLLALDRAVREELVQGGVTRWAIPVNMRGAPGLNPKSINQFSAIHVLCAADTDLPDLHGRIRAKFKEANHWANWALMHIGKHIGLARAEKFFIDGYKNPRPGTGGISSVGEWKSDRVGADEAWVAFAMVSKISPISAVTLTVNGKLSITLQVHPSLHSTEASIRALLQAWVQAIHKVTDLALLQTPVWTAQAASWQIARADSLGH